MHSNHTITLPDRAPLVLGATPVVMGILNVTPDSFSDGGAHNLVQAAVAHAHQLVAEGAGIIDIGGESTRPGAAQVGVQEELDRVMPVLDALKAEGFATPISIDTYKPLVADQAIQAGASIINDVFGLQFAPEMAEVAETYRVPLIAMHWDKDRDRTLPLLDEVHRYFLQTLKIAQDAGVALDQIILDPGYGFAKTVSDNYALLRDVGILARSETFGRAFPILVGVSRKSMIGKLLDIPTEARLAGTIAGNVLAYQRGAHIFRVHDVKANVEALRVAQATLYGPPAELD
jgi:dihydropteroate synthase